MASAFLIFGAVLTAVTAIGGAVVAGVGLLFELYLFVRAGVE